MDGYDGERTLVLEDFAGGIPYRTILRMLDNYRFEMQTKGGYVPAAWTTVLITSNLRPAHWYDDATDPWGVPGPDGTVQEGPLQRRINVIVQYNGTYAQDNVVMTLENGPRSGEIVDRMPTYEEYYTPPPPAEEPEGTEVSATEPTQEVVQFNSPESSLDVDAFFSPNPFGDGYNTGEDSVDLDEWNAAQDAAAILEDERVFRMMQEGNAELDKFLDLEAESE
jgi:hypothetical protein